MIKKQVTEENKNQAGNEGDTIESELKVWEVVECLIGAHINYLTDFLKNSECIFLSFIYM